MNTTDKTTTDKPVTVAQACRILSVSERTLRRILRQSEIAAQTVAEHRRTATGWRRSVLLTPELISHLKKTIFAGDADGSSVSIYTGINDGEVLADAGNDANGVTLAYERLIAEQAARIADLQAALAYERKHSQELSTGFIVVQETLTVLQAEKAKIKDRPKAWRERFK